MPSNRFTAIELCCGSASLSAALRLAGLEAVGVDFERNPQKPRAPVANCNLADTVGQQKALQLIDMLNPLYIHAAPPCGTATRAREKPMPTHLKQRGAPEPRQLRSNQFPLGLQSGLNERETLMLNLANAVYKFVFELCIKRALTNKLFSIENPTNSYMWQTPWALELLQLPGVYIDDFPQCCHGGSRPVMRRWVSNIQQFKALRGSCPGQSSSHIHKKFGAEKINGIWKFATAEEATYPQELCRKVSKLVTAELASHGVDLLPTTMSRSGNNHVARRLVNRAIGGKFVRGNKIPPILSEFLEVKELNVPISTCVGTTIEIEDDQKAKVLRLKWGEAGERQSEVDTVGAVVGIFRSPAQFIDAAWSIKHPIDMPSFIPESIVRNLFWLLTTSRDEIIQFRMNAIRKLRLKAMETMKENEELHASISPSQERVLEGKQFALMKWALKEAGYPDDKLVDQLLQGIPLTGTVAPSSIFPGSFKPRTIEPDELLKSSAEMRKLCIASTKSSGDTVIDKAVWLETQDEVAKGWLSAAYSETEVAAELGTLFTVARRFGIKQGDKIRSIDDYSLPGVNSTVDTLEKIDLLGPDEMFIMLKLIASSVKESGEVLMRLHDGSILRGRLPEGVQPSEARSWIGKTFDLESAYRQLATSDDAGNKRFCVISVYDPDSDQAKLFIQHSVPFGAVSSVYYFNRAARAIWALGVHFLRLTWLNYFDDFPAINPENSATECDVATRALFLLLGWNLSRNEKKTKPFKPRFQMLGVVADLSELVRGTAIFSNKEDRVAEISTTIDEIVFKKNCQPPLMASLRGRVLYASQQTFGRLAIGPLHVMSYHQQHSRSGNLDRDTMDAILALKKILTESPPRSLNCLGEQRPLLLFTDGAAEGSERNVVTCGAVMIDTAEDWAEMFGGLVPPRLVKVWKRQGQQIQVIGQAELLPVLLAKIAWRGRFKHRRLICFLDNDSARQALIKGWSPSQSSNAIVKEMLSRETSDLGWNWYGRVPTHSNPADEPSRLILIPSDKNDQAGVIPMPRIPDDLFINS